jgi:hypothetical protein
VGAEQELRCQFKGESSMPVTYLTPKPLQVAAAVIGNALEWYDFTIFGFLTVVIARLFFPADSQYASLLLTTATFGVVLFYASGRRRSARALCRSQRPKGRLAFDHRLDDGGNRHDRVCADLRGHWCGGALDHRVGALVAGVCYRR